MVYICCECLCYFEMTKYGSAGGRGGGGGVLRYETGIYVPHRDKNGGLRERPLTENVGLSERPLMGKTVDFGAKRNKEM